MKVNSRWVARYGAALAAVGAGVLVRLALTAWVGPGLPTYITFYPAVMAVALLGGLGPGLVATAALAVAADYWVIEPIGFGVERPVDVVGQAIFCGMGLFMSLVAEYYRRAQIKAEAFDREQALREARQEKEFLATVLERAAQPFAVSYPDRRLGRFNRAYQELTGYTAEELRSMDWATVLTPPEWREPEGQKLEELNRTGQPVRYEKEYLRQDGRRVPVELLVHLARDAEGKPECYYAFVTDTTERKRVEVTLRQNQENLDRAQEVAQIGWWRLDTQRNVLIWSDENHRIFGVPKGTALTYEAFLDAVHPDDRQYVDTRWRASLRGEAYDIEHRIVADGRVKWVREKAYLEMDAAGGLLGGFGITQDITQRKQAEQELRESEEQFRTLADSIPNLAWWANADGYLTWYNQRWYEYTGTTPQQMEGWGWQSVHDPAALPAVLERWKASLASGEPLDMTFPLRGADGVFRPFLTRVIPLKDAQGRVQRWFGTNTDVSEQQEAQEAVRRLNTELQQRLADLQVANQQVQAVNASLHVSRRAALNLMEDALTARRQAEEASVQMRRLAEQRRLALEAADLGAWDYDFRAGQVFWDERCREMWGLTADEHVAYATAISRIHPEDRAGVDRAVQEALAGRDAGGYQREFRVVWADGSVHWIASHGHVYFEGEGDQRKPVRFVGANLEITAEREASEALRESRERLAAFAAASFEGIVLSDRGRIVDCNEQFAQMAGCTVPELKGRLIEELIAPEDRERVVESIRAGRESTTEHQMLRRDGSRLTVETHGRSSDPDGRGLRHTAVRDITERKHREEQLRKLNRTLQALKDSSNAMVRATSEEEYLHEVCRIAVEICGHAMVWIGLAEDDPEKSVRPVASAGFEQGYLETLRVTWADTERGRGPTGTAIRTGKPCGCKDLLTDPQFAPWRAEALKRGYASSLVVPLLAGGRAFGAISLYAQKPDAFTEDEVTLLTELADDVAYCIRTLRLRAERARAERRTEILADTASELLTTESPQTVVDALCHKVLAFLDCQAFFNFLVDEQAGRLRLNACAGVPNEDIQKMEWLDYGTAICGCAARDGCRIVAEDIQATPDPRTDLVKSFGIQAYACHPLVIERRVLGTLSFGTRTRTRFCEEELSLMKAVTDLVAIAMERQRAQASLRRANEELEQRVAERTAELHAASRYSRSLIEASLDPLVTISPEGRVTDVNEATELVTGVQRERLIGSDFADYFTEPAKAKAGYQQVLAEGSVRDYPLTIRHVSGRTTDVLYNATVYRNQAGQVQGVFAAARDVTERKRIERELQVSEARYRSLVSATSQIVWTTDPAGQVATELPAWEVFTGQTWDQYQGSGWTQAVHPEDRQRTQAVWLQAVNSRGLYEIEYRLWHRDGEYREVVARGVPLLGEDGSIREWVGTCTDITERKQAERRRDFTSALLALFAQKTSAREYLNSAVNAIQQWTGCQALGIRIADEAGEIPYAAWAGFEPRFLELENQLSLQRDNCCCIRAISQAFEPPDRSLVTPGGSYRTDDAKAFINALPPEKRACYRGNCMKFGFASLVVIPVRYLDKVIGAIHLADCRPNQFPLAVVEFLETMTPLIGEAVHRFQTEAELARHRDQLEVLVQQRTRELTDANARLQRTAEELQRSNRDLEQFAYVASHDLQEPLRAVGGYVRLLERQCADTLDDRARKCIAGAFEGAIRMEQLINDLLAFSRVGTRGGQFVPTHLDMVLQRALANLQVSIEAGHASVTHDPLPTLTVDPTQFMQVFQNLIGNALKFRGQAPPVVHIGAKRQDGHWVFSVRDNGIGIDRQFYGKLFQLFQRLHTRKEYPGTGIGLVICKRIIERHGGRIWVESQLGQGATFYFSIPETTG